MKLCGLQPKAVKVTRGHEGEALDSCNLYYENKKVGSFETLDWGGGWELNIPDNFIQKLSELYCEARVPTNTFEFDTYTHAALAVNEMLKIHGWEQQYKKRAKRAAYINNLAMYYIIAYGDNGSPLGETSYCVNRDFAMTKEVIQSFVSETKEYFAPRVVKGIRIYRFHSLDDFSMNSLTDRIFTQSFS